MLYINIYILSHKEIVEFKTSKLSEVDIMTFMPVH